MNSILSRKSLLLYYTADEPDGTSDPLTAPLSTASLIRSLDPYHPISLVLNCYDYYWTDYTEAADVVLQDAYSVGNNVTWSLLWDTVCDEVQGCCGCDNCVGGFGDVRSRVEVFKERMESVGWERSKRFVTSSRSWRKESLMKYVSNLLASGRFRKLSVKPSKPVFVLFLLSTHPPIFLLAL